jgi:hypothetical protein
VFTTAAFALGLSISGPVAATRSDGPDPYAIFSRARLIWETARYPQNVAYTIRVTVTQGQAVKTLHYHAAYAPLSQTLSVDGVSDEERAHPHVPKGINVALLVFPVGKPEERMDFIGVPRLAPNYAFGIAPHPGASPAPENLVAEIRREFHDPPPKRPPASTSTTDLPEIAAVLAVHRDYTISFGGVEPIDGHDDYHLVLEPLRDPRRFRLRDVWVDARTYATDRLITDGNFVDGPASGARWTVDFVQIDGTPYIASERTSEPFSAGADRYDSATIAFEAVRAAPRAAYESIAHFDAPLVLEEPDD